MTQQLTQEDIKTLRRETRTGYILGFVLLFVLEVFVLLNLDLIREASLVVPIQLVCLTLTISLVFLLNRKYWIDARNGMKRLEKGYIQDWEEKTDYEIMGSAWAGHNEEMKAKKAYAIIVDYVRYPLSKEDYVSFKQVKEVDFHYGLRSGLLLGITPASARK
jgi:hypothetical protein